MRKLLLPFICFGILATSCTTTKMSPDKTPEIYLNKSYGSLDINQIKKAIIEGCNKSGWDPTVINYNEILAQILVRGKYFAAVTISFTADKVQIKYNSSKGLRHDLKDKNIHRKYYDWTNRLKDSIQNELLKNKYYSKQSYSHY